MWKDSIRYIVVIFQPNILRIVGFYVRHSANNIFNPYFQQNMFFVPSLNKTFSLGVTYLVLSGVGIFFKFVKFLFEECFSFAI